MNSSHTFPTFFANKPQIFIFQFTFSDFPWISLKCLKFALNFCVLYFLLQIFPQISQKLFKDSFFFKFVSIFLQFCLTFLFPSIFHKNLVYCRFLHQMPSKFPTKFFYFFSQMFLIFPYIFGVIFRLFPLKSSVPIYFFKPTIKFSFFFNFPKILLKNLKFTSSIYSFVSSNFSSNFKIFFRVSSLFSQIFLIFPCSFFVNFQQFSSRFCVVNCCFNKYRKPAFLAQLCRARVFRHFIFFLLFLIFPRTFA